MSIEIILQQTLIIFAYVAVGWVLQKTGVVAVSDTRLLSRVITTCTLPLSILAATNTETAPQDLLNMLWMGLLLLGMMAAASAAALGLAARAGFSPAKRAIFCGLTTYPNVSFMGIPLCTALMGSWGGLYGTAAVCAYNVLFFTLQTSLFRPGQRIRLKAFITPLNLATVAAILMLALGLRLPAVPQTVCANVGAITSPLALMIVGVMLGGSRVLDVFRDGLGYLATALRNLLWPLVLLAVLLVLPVDRTMALAAMVFAVTPCANLTAVFAAQTDMEPQLCSRVVLLSTLLSLATMPLVLTLAEQLL